MMQEIIFEEHNKEANAKPPRKLKALVTDFDEYERRQAKEEVEDWPTPTVVKNKASKVKEAEEEAERI